jgi:3,4-dihydroxy 2-butanone 4-phosphate synthase / GTP cyclohydrolase II
MSETWDNPHRCSIEEAIEEIRQGRMVIVVDDENRENEGDFIFSGTHVTTEKVNFFLKYARGMICVPMSREIAHRLGLDPMVERNTDTLSTNFTVTVDHSSVTTGISAEERFITIKSLADENTQANDLRRPGHINPLIARDGGVLVRAGHTEAAADLCRLAGLPEVGVICEILNENGTMARRPDLERVAETHGCKIITIEDLITYRTSKEKLVRKLVSTILPNPYGVWNLHLYENILNGEQHTALVLGDPEKAKSTLVRVHSQCFTGDTLLSQRCDCGQQLETAMKMIAENGHGVILYLSQEGRGIGLHAKLQAYNLQDEGLDTVEANVHLGFKPDHREYGIGCQILSDLGLTKIKLLTNNPRKIVGISGYNLDVIDRVALEIPHQKHNERYLRTKAEKMDHMLAEFQVSKDETKTVK